MGLFRLVEGLALAAGAMLSVRLALGNTLYAPPISVTVMDFVLGVCLIAGARLGLRLLRQWAVDFDVTDREAAADRGITRVVILGAGEAGSILAQDILLKSRFRMKPVAFLDDDRSKWKTEIHGVPVLGPPERLREGLVAEKKLDQAIIAMPSASSRRRRELVELLQAVGLPFQTIPSMDQLAKGHVQVSQIRPVEIEDLLGRPPVRLDTANIHQMLFDRVVMVTGAGGSIGAELCEQIAAHAPGRLVLVERAEGALFEIEQTLIEQGHGERIRPLLGDVTDAVRMRQMFRDHRPAVIFHAAAHKHVPMMEGQVGEAIKNNALGTALLADLADEFGVERFVLVSTDKAINPVNVMGATKRLAELYVQARNGTHAASTRFMAVRFGNVLGSSGSVIPRFKKQIAAGGPVLVTCPEIMRYFMTIPEAVGLVLQCATQGRGGEIFVLDMGSPVKIADLARQLIRLSGFRPDEDIEIRYTGLRPGEKCFEELNYSGEDYSPTPHPSIMRFTAPPPLLTTVAAHLESLRAALLEGNEARLRDLLQAAVPEYQPRNHHADAPVAHPTAGCQFGQGLAEPVTAGSPVPDNCPCLAVHGRRYLAPSSSGGR